MRARDNPFASHRLHAVRYRLPGLSWDELLARLAGLGHRAAIVGGEGRGKTALLEALSPRLREHGFILRTATLSRERTALPADEERCLTAGLGAADLVVVDGAGHLGRLAWRRLVKRTAGAGGLLVTAHRPGFLPTLVDCLSSPELLAEIVAELLAGAPAGLDAAALPAATELFARHRGNLREALRELYDHAGAL